MILRDPRDLLRVYELDREGDVYIEVPCARQERPSITLFEHRQGVAQIKAVGRAQVDEDAIFRAVAAQRAMTRLAAAKTRSAPRRLARGDAAPASSEPAGFTHPCYGRVPSEACRGFRRPPLRGDDVVTT